MKKFTIFLLTFLLFVGFMNANAQTKALEQNPTYYEEPGGPSKTATYIDANISTALFCSPPTDNIQIYFFVTGGTADPLSPPKVWTATEIAPGVTPAWPDDYTEVPPGEVIATPPYISFNYDGRIYETTWFVATVVQTTGTGEFDEHGDPIYDVVTLKSEPKPIYIIEELPEVFFDPSALYGIMCTGADLELDAWGEWDEAPENARFRYSLGTFLDGVPLGTVGANYTLGDIVNILRENLLAGNHKLEFKLLVRDYNNQPASGCDVSDSIKFKVVDPPVVTVLPNTQNMCEDGRARVGVTSTFTNQYWDYTVKYDLSINGVYKRSIEMDVDATDPNPATAIADTAFYITKADGLNLTSTDPCFGENSVKVTMTIINRDDNTNVDAHTCTDDKTVNINVYKRPDSPQIITQNTTKCENGTFDLAAEEPTCGTGIWAFKPIEPLACFPAPNTMFDDASSLTPTISGVPAGSTVTVIWTVKNNYCTPLATDTVSIILVNHLKPIVELVDAITHHNHYEYRVCANDELDIELDIIPGGQLDDNCDRPADADFTYLWKLEGDEVGDEAHYEFDTSEPGEYTLSVTVTQDDTECEVTEIITVIVWELPVVTLDEEEYIVCDGEPLDITATTTGGDRPFSYTWDSGDLESDDNHSIGRHNVLTVDTELGLDPHGPPYEGTISVTVTDRHGCEATASADITIYPLPEVDFELPRHICGNDEPFELIGNYYPDGEFSGDCVVPIEEIINEGEPEEDIIIVGYNFDPSKVTPGSLTTVTYTYTASNEIDCTNSITKEIRVLDYPVIELQNAGNPPAYSCCVNSPYTITAEVHYDNGGNHSHYFHYTWAPEDIDGTPLTQGSHQLSSTFTVNTDEPGEGTISVSVTDSRGCTSNIASAEVVIHELPELKKPLDVILACEGETGTITATILNNPDEPNIPTITWEKYNDVLDVWELYASNVLSVNYTGLALGDPTEHYRVIVETAASCTDTAYCDIDYFENPVQDLAINQLPTPICNHNTINLCATYTPAVGSVQTFEWFYTTFDGNDWSLQSFPTGLTTLCGNYFIDVDDAVVEKIQFELIVNTEGCNCPTSEVSDEIEIRKSIKTEIVGSDLDTICHGGSVEIRYALSNFDAMQPVYYRWYENNLFHEGENAIHMMTAGATEVYMVTYPALHNSEEGPASYCYTVETWQGNVDPLDPTDCHSFSACHYVMVLKDPVVTISGPTTVALQALSAEFTANVVGGWGDITYTWYLDGVEDDTATGAVYTLTDPDILNTAGTHDIAVKVKQSYPGCEAELVVHHFEVGCPPQQVEIVGPESACVGSTVTLTAVVTGDYVEYQLQWYFEGTPIPGEQGHTLEIVVGADVDLLEYTVKITYCGCEMQLAPAHYLQVIPNAVLVVDNYVICEEGSVTVTANAVTWGNTEIYRYIWYNSNKDAIDTTYINNRIYKDIELDFDAEGKAQAYVSAEMLNSACNTDTVEFIITMLGELAKVAISPATETACEGKYILFTLGEDVNIALYGTPTYAWWVDGVEVPGESLDYLNISFEAGIHFVEAHLTYPGNGCEYLTDKATVTIIAAPESIEIGGLNLFCEAPATIELGALVTPLPSTAYTYQWYKDGLPITDAIWSLYTETDVTAQPAPYYYFVEATTKVGGCKIVSSLYPVIVNEAPFVPIYASEYEICINGEVTVTAEIGNNPTSMTYQWFLNNHPTLGRVAIPGAVTPIYTLSPNPTFGPYTYELEFEATDIASECVATSNVIEIAVKAQPVIAEVTVDAELICAGDEVVVIATNITGGVYTWYRNGILIDGADLFAFREVLTEAGTYRYSVKVTLPGSGCVSEMVSTGDVTVMAAPESIEIGGLALFCEAPATIELGALVTPLPSNAYTYQWYKDGLPVTGAVWSLYTETDVAAQPAPYYYFVEATNAAGCKIVSNLYPVIVNEAPFVPIYASEYEICIDGEVTLTADIGNNPTGMTYQWYLKNHPIVGRVAIPGAVTPIYTLSPNPTFGPYTYELEFEATDIASECVATSNVIEIAVKAQPVIAEVTVDTELICAGDEVVVIATNITGGVYTWYRNGILIDGADLFAFREVLAEAGTYRYSVKVTLPGSGCVSEMVSTGDVTVMAVPESIEIGGLALFCEAPATIELGALVTPLPSNAYTYQWYKDGLPVTGAVWSLYTETNVAAQPAPYYYFVEATNAAGCKIVSSLYPVIVNEAPFVPIYASEYKICEGGEVTVTAEIGNNPMDMTYQWYLKNHPTLGRVAIPGAITPIYTLSPIPGLGAYTYEIEFEATNIASECVAYSNVIEIEVITINNWLDPLGVYGLPGIWSQLGYRFCVDGTSRMFVTQASGSVMFNPSDVIFTWYKNGAIVPGANTYEFYDHYTEAGQYFYRVTIEGPSGCVYTTPILDIVVMDPPIIQVTGPQTLCSDGPVAVPITATGILPNPSFPPPYPQIDFRFQFYVDGLLQGGWEVTGTATFTKNLTLAPRPTPYIITVLGAYLNYAYPMDGCQTWSEEFPVTIYESLFPEIGITADKTTICPEETVMLTADAPIMPDITYQWYKQEPLDNEPQEMVGFNTPIIYVNPSVTTIYTFKATLENAECEANSNPVTVKVIQTPVITISDDADICDGEAVILTATQIFGATYTWYRDGVIIPGAVAYKILDYLHAVNGNITDYTYTAVASVFPGCVSEISNEITVTVHPAPEITIEGPTEICEGMDLTLNGFIFNPDGTTSYLWTMPGVVGMSVDPLEYLTGFAEGYEFEVDHLLGAGYDASFAATHTTPPYNGDSYSTGGQGSGALCIGGAASSNYFMYNLGAGEAVQDGIDAGSIAANSAADDFIATIEAALIAQATMDASTDAQIAGPYITEALGMAKAQAYATALVTPLLKQSMIDLSTYSLNSLTILTAPDPDPSTGAYVPSWNDIINIPCLGYYPQIAAYKAGYYYGYWGAYTTTFKAKYYQSILDQIVDLYAGTYSTVFGNEYNEILDVISSGSSTPGPLGSEITLTVSNLEARPYPYQFYLTVTNGYGCSTTVGPHSVLVNPEPKVTITASENEICEGGEAILTAHVDESIFEVTYEWYKYDEDLDEFVALNYHAAVLTVTEGGIYRFTATQNNGCVATSNTVTIEIIATPEITVTTEPAGTICAGEQVTVTATTVENGIYTWYRNGIVIAGADLYSFSEVLTQAGTYIYSAFVTIPGSGCVSEIASATEIEVKAAPSVVISGPTFICGNAEDATLIAMIDPVDAEVEYQWFLNGEEIEDATESTLDISDLEPSPYPYNFTVQITDSESGCVILSAVHPVNVEQFLVIGITADKTTICPEEIVMLTANVSDDPNMEYQWYADGIAIDDEIAPIAYVTPAATTVYTFTATQIGSECVATSNTVTVHVIPIPEIIDITVEAADICDGEPVIITATRIPGAIYTWYRDGMLIQGAGTYRIIDFPPALNGNITEYAYSVYVSVFPGCISVDLDEDIIITVHPAPEVIIEGPTEICEGMELILHGFVFNPQGTLTYQWTMPGLDGVYADATDYLEGFVEGYENRIDNLVQPYFGADFATTHPVPAYANSYSTSPNGTGIICLTMTATSNYDMYNYGADEAEPAGTAAGTAYATGIANLFIADIEDALVAQAEMDAAADALVAGPFITSAEGIVKGQAYATALVTPLFGQKIIDQFTYPTGSLTPFTAPDPTSGPYTLANTYCPGYYLQVVAYKAGYWYGYWDAYNTAFIEEYRQSIIDQIVDLYTTKYVEVFTAEYHEIIDIIESGSSEVGVVSTDIALIIPDLPARPYPYLFYLTVTSEYGCSTTVGPHEVLVNPEPQVTITVSETQICEGGEAILTAHVDESIFEVTYEWYKYDEDLDEFVALNYHAATLIVTEAGIYKFTATHNNGCVATSNEITIEIIATPEITVTTEPAGTICAGEQVTVTATEIENGVYTWYRNGIVIDDADLYTFSEVLTQAGTYIYSAFVTIPGSGCVSEIASATEIEVKAAPSVVISGPTFICDNAEGATLIAMIDPVDAEVEYQWFLNGEEIEDATESTLDISDLESSPYPYNFTVQITDSESGCVILSAVYPVNVEQFLVIGITADPTNICAGDIVMLTANVNDDPNMIYQWYYLGEEDEEPVWIPLENENAPIAYVYPTATTTYSFTATQIGSECVATSNEVTVTVIPAPIVEIEEPIEETICQGDQVIFTVDAIASNAIYKWFVGGVEVQGATSYQMAYTFDMPGVFEVQVQATSIVAECTSPLVYAGTITVVPAPSVEILGSTIVCPAEVGDPHLLFAMVTPTPAAGDVTYVWYEDDEIVGTNSPYQEINDTPIEGHYTYHVKVIDNASGCEVMSAAHFVYVYEPPKIPIHAVKTAVCEGETVELYADITPSNNTVYQWYEDTGNGPQPIQGATSTICYHNPTQTTIYTFTAEETGTNCHATSDSITVTVSNTIFIVIEEPVIAEICAGEQVSFEAPFFDDVDYVWYINDVVVPGAILQTFTPTFPVAGVYQVKVSTITHITECLSNVAIVGTVTVKSAPTVHIEGATVVCDTSEPTHLVAIVAPLDGQIYAYQWYEYYDGIPTIGSTTNTQVVNTAASPYPYIYVVEVTDTESGCVVLSEAHTVYVGQYSEIGITANKENICMGETVVLTANVSESINMLYQWYDNGFIIPGATTPIYNYYAGPATPYGEHRFTFTATLIGTDCIATSNEVVVTVFAIPEVTNSILIATICEGDQVTFNASVVTPGAGTEFYYTWYINGQEQTGYTTGEVTFPFNQAGTYNIQVSATTLVAGCTSQIVDAGIITVKAPPTVTIEGPTEVCNATNPDLLHAYVTPFSEEIYEYQWYEYHNGVPTEGSTTSTQVINNVPSPYPYIYIVKVTDIESGCVVYSEAHTVTVSTLAPIIITSNISRACLGTTITITPDLIDTYNMTYQWYDDDGLIPNATNPVYTVTPVVGTHTYHLIATQIESGCTARSNDVTVIIDPIPDQPNLTISSTTICSGDPVTITGNIEGIYHWTRNGAPIPGVLSAITDQPTANNILTTYCYTATVTVNNCTSVNSAPVCVTVHPTFNVAVEGGHEVCEQALEGEHLALHAILYEPQPGVSYRYVWTYVQGNNPAVTFFDAYDNPYCVVPNNWPANDPAAPYCVYVVVTANDYGCTTTSACHEVNILVKPTVVISVDNESICLGGTITATAYATPTPTPENPYDYVWTVNGVVQANNTFQIAITDNLLIGVNEITVTIQRSYGSLSCFGTDTYFVNVLTPPSLALTQDIAGGQWPGMCVDGRVNLAAEVIDFDASLIDPNDFIFEWTRNWEPIPTILPYWSETLPVPDTYIYRVKAHLNNNLGCNIDEWVAFDPVKVVPQAIVKIYANDYNDFEVCQGAVIVLNNTLPQGITDPVIQTGFEYCWNDLSSCEPFTNQIPPRTVEFNTIGTRTFFLGVKFINPTCKAIVSEELTYTVVVNPEWDIFKVEADTYNGICLGESVKLEATYKGGDSQINNGIIQWFYRINGGAWVPCNDQGGYVTHIPTQPGIYEYMVTYTPTNELSGCNIEPRIYGTTLEVLEIIQPTAYFDLDKMDALPLNICANNPYSPNAESVELVIAFTGTPPFIFTIKESNGTVRNLVTNLYEYRLIVTPKVTTVYTIETMYDHSQCASLVFIPSDITVYVTNVEIPTTDIEACNNTTELQMKVNSFVSDIATINFVDLGLSWTKQIKQSGDKWILTIDIPSTVPVGVHNVIVTIDKCEYPITIINNYNDNDNTLVVRRWEGYGEVLVVNNNPVNNGGYTFTSYQWYKNGELIPGATQQYYQDPNGVNGWYSVRLTGTKVVNGVTVPVEFRTCEKAFNPTGSMKVYPVPAHINETVTLELELTPEQLKDAVLDIYDAKGAFIKQVQITSSITHIEGMRTSGMYTGKITTGTSEIKAIKFVIVQ